MSNCRTRKALTTHPALHALVGTEVEGQNQLLPELYSQTGTTKFEDRITPGMHMCSKIKISLLREAAS